MKYIVVVVISSLFTVLSGLSNVAHAQETIPEGTQKIIIEGKTYYLHKVKKGEGLYRISVSYNVSQKEILELNPDAALGLKKGQLLKIPIIRGRNSTSEQLQSEKYIYHTVEKGQTAYYISKKYRVDLNVVYENNPGSDKQLMTGVIIKIPKSEVRPVGYEINKEGFIIHKVKPKETLYGLSKHYNVNIEDIVKYNKGLESGVLNSGSYIRIPSDSKKKSQINTKDIADKDFEDSDFFYHKIKGGETLFSIAQQYNIKPFDLTEANKSINAQNMPIGYLIRIPKGKIKSDEKPSKSDDAILFDHVVKRKETLYKISRKYNVEIEILKKVNSDAGIDLKPFRKKLIIKIPNAKWIEEYNKKEQLARQTEDADYKEVMHLEKKECDRYDYSLSKPAIKVALMLPFNTHATRNLNYKTKRINNQLVEVEKEVRVLSMKSKVFVEFYQGVLLALDGLKKEGVNVDLFVYDTAPDSNKVTQVLQKPEMKLVDLIIGPAYSQNLKAVSEFSTEYKIPMVYPLSTLNNEIENNPLLFQANTSDTLMFDIMANRILQNAKGKRLVMIRTENEDSEYEQRLSDMIRNKVYWESFKSGEVPDFIEYKFKQDDIASLERMLDKSKGNTVIIPSNEEAQVSRIVTTVKGAAVKTRADVTLWGLPDWMKFNTLDPQDIHKLNGHIFSYYAVDYNDYINDSLIKNYRHWFHTEPIAISPFFQTASVNSNMSRYSLWGHDISYFFISAIKEYGSDFPYCISHHKPHTIQSKLYFSRISNWGGFYNMGLLVLKFNPDYKLEIEGVKK